jgi:hypothetical protein
MEVDLAGVKAGFGVAPETEGLTYRELQARRDLIRSRFAERESSEGRRRFNRH